MLWFITIHALNITIITDDVREIFSYQIKYGVRNDDIIPMSKG